MTAQTIRVAILTLALSASAATAVAQQRQSDQTAYTLYRNSPMFKDRPHISQRIYIASFDAANEEEFNRTNCETAAELLTEHKKRPLNESPGRTEIGLKATGVVRPAPPLRSEMIFGKHRCQRYTDEMAQARILVEVLRKQN